MKTQYYLFKNSRATGPYTQIEIDQLIKSRKILTYSWMIDPNEQNWKPIETKPSLNPFESVNTENVSLNLLAAFTFRNQIFSGSASALNSVGLSIDWTNNSPLSLSMPVGYVLTLNLINLSEQIMSNSRVTFQKAVRSENGYRFYFNWCECPTPLIKTKGVIHAN